MALTHTAHKLISQHFSEHSLAKNLAIDATCGNGHDTLFLVNTGFKRVLAFDIQTQAINATKQRLTEFNNHHISIIQDSHESMQKHTSQSADCIMFNLGYLPNSDKSITTLAKSTIKALDASVALLSNNGILSLLCYPGHPTGKTETQTIIQWLTGLDSCWEINEIKSPIKKPYSPILFLIKRQSTSAQL